jgi:transposase
MNLFVGFDISLDETSVCIADYDGKTVREAKVATDPDAIAEALARWSKGIKRVGIEASSLGIWLHHELKARGFPVIMVETHHMRTALSAMRAKTDRNDARGIAHMMRVGWFRAVHVKSKESQQLHTLLANRRLLKRKLIEMENHIRGSLRTYGLRVGNVGRGDYEARVQELIEAGDEGLRAMITTLLIVRRSMLDGVNSLHKILIRIVAADPVCRQFMTVPGVGPVAALSYKVGVDDPVRFARSRNVGAYFGITPRRHQSGTIDQVGHITRQGDGEVRVALVEAAASLLIRVKQWSALKAWGMRIAKRTSMKNAIVAVARKLAVILHRMWIAGAEFNWTRGAKITKKLKLAPPVSA